MTAALTPMRRREVHAAKAQVLSSDGVRQMFMAYRGRMASVHPKFKFKPGFIYVQVRAISARINQNFDGWPSQELAKSYRSFIGKPIFVNHQNFDPKKARGKVVASRYVEAGDDKYIETVMEIDAARFPKLAQEVIGGGLDAVSMGVEAGFTICSYCGNRAVDVPEFCEHVKFHKGQTLGRVTRTGAVEPVLVYEKCYKLGFFELSYVFDPADETAVVSRVIAASSHYGDAAAQPVADEIVEGQMPTEVPPTGVMPTAALEAHINRLAYGEIEAPEDVDTLRDENDDDNDEFQHWVESPKELQGPDMDLSKRLDRAQEQEGLDSDRRVEDVEDVGGSPQGGRPMPARNARRSRGGASVLVDPRTGRRYYAAEDDDSGPPPPPPGGGDSGKSDEDLIQEAESDLEKADEAGAGDDDSDDPGSDAGGTDDDQSDSDDEPDDDSDDGDDSDLPPWLKGGDTDDSGPPPPPPSKESRRRGGNRGTSTQKKRRARKGAPVSLAERQRVAAAQWPRRHYADESGHTDGGPYHRDDNDQGEQEKVFISDTPGSEPVSAPVPGDGTISNSENNLVAHRLQQRIQARNAEQRRDLIAYEQVTGQRIGADVTQPSPAPAPTGAAGLPASDPGLLDPYMGRRRYADDGEWPDPPAQSIKGTEVPEKVDPTVQDPGGEKLTGEFDDVALDNVETQPKNAAFQAFDSWLRQTTGKTARQHGNAQYIRRAAAHYCQGSGRHVESLFPALGNVLREARRNEGSTNRRSTMRRRADDKLEVAAPQDRIDVEKPVSDTTDADAQASQFDLGDFGDNAGDNLADPELSPDSQIWAPGEGDSAKTSNRKADGMTAVRYAEAYIRAGLAPNTADEKWKVAGLAMTMRHGTIVDRTRLLEAINNQRAAAARRTAGVNRGAGSSIPPGFGQRQLAAGTAHLAANSQSDDAILWIR